MSENRDQPLEDWAPPNVTHAIRALQQGITCTTLSGPVVILQDAAFVVATVPVDGGGAPKRHHISRCICCCDASINSVEKANDVGRGSGCHRHI